MPAFSRSRAGRRPLAGRSSPRARVHLVGSASRVRVVSSVCAALAVCPILLGCRTPQGASVPTLGAVALQTTPRGGRASRVTFELPNGLSVVLEESHVAPVVALQAWVGAGAADEAPEEAGVAHVVERVVLAGAKEGEMGEGGTGSGAGAVAAWSSHDATVFETLAAAPLAGAGVDGLAALLARAPFEPAEIERARADVIGELRRRAADPAALTTQALFAAAFGPHAYGRDPLGSEPTVKALTGAQVAAFHRRHYVAGNVTLVAVGDFDARALRGRISAAFGALPRGASSRASRPLPAGLGGPRAGLVAGVPAADVRQERLAVGFRLPGLSDEGLAAADLMAVVLARGDDGLLARELVKNRQLAVGARASVFSASDGGLLILEARLVAGRAEDAARVVLDEALRLAREELPVAELDAARAALEADLVRGQETTSGYARKLGYFATVARDPDYEDHYLRRLRALTPSDARAAAAKILRASNVALAALIVDPAGRSAAEARARLQDVAAASEARADARRIVAAPAAVTAVQDVVRVVLPAGPRVLVLRDPTVHAVWVHALWSGGVRLENARDNGLTTLLAATLARGTRTRPAPQVLAEAAALGGELAGFASADELGVRAQFLARHWERGFELFADCLRHPAFPEAEVEAARRAQLSRVRADDDDPARAAARLFASTLWPRHSYRLPVLGTAESVSTLTRRRLVDHYRRFYGATNLIIAVVGDVDTERVVAKLQALFADAPAPLADPVPAPSSEDRDPAAAEVVRLGPRETARFVLGYGGVSLHDPERSAAEVLAGVLGGPAGRLARELGPASVADVRSWSGADGGSLTMDVASTPDGIDAAVPALRTAVGRVVAAGFTEPEVARARRALVAARVLALERRGEVAAAVAREEALGLGAGRSRGEPAELAAVTPEAVTRVARRLLDPRREIVVAVRPPSGPAVAKAAAPKLIAPKTGPGGGRPRAP
jgi:zinc protease